MFTGVEKGHAMRQETRTDTWLWTRIRTVTFTIADARRALTYLSRVVRDAHAAYHRAQRVRSLLRHTESPAQRAVLIAELNDAVRHLDAATDECDAVGTTMVDLSRGIVAFPAQVGEQPVTLIWRIGEPIRDAWWDVEATGACVPRSPTRNDGVIGFENEAAACCQPTGP